MMGSLFKRAFSAVAVAWTLSAAAEDFLLEPPRGMRVNFPGLSFSIQPLVHGEKWRQMGQIDVPSQEPYAPPASNRVPFAFRLNGRPLFDAVADVRATDDGAAMLDYQLTALSGAVVEAVSLQTSVPRNWQGGARFSVDGVERTNGTYACRRVRLEGAANGSFLELETGPEITKVCLIPSRDGKFVTLRLLRTGHAAIRAGERYDLRLTCRTNGRLENLYHPWTAQAGPDFVPLAFARDIVPGSILDFSSLVPRAPCGTYGRLQTTPDGHFTFEKLPGSHPRFYGINLHSYAVFLPLDEARRLTGRLVRLGYNAVRFHNIENSYMGLMKDSPDEATPPERNFAGLDNMMLACRERGLYVTTDLYVGWRPSFRSLGIDREGAIATGAQSGKTSFKYEVLVNPTARAHFKTFVRHFLNHVNPHTGLRYGDDPTLALLSVVNESSCMWSGVAHTNDLCRLETAFMKDMTHFIHNELGFAQLPLTANNSRTPFCLQYSRAADYDYVDMHHYFDHPQWPAHARSVPVGGKLPIFTRNERVFAEGHEILLAPLLTRIWGKPHVVTEFNWCAPSLYRGAAGLVFGAVAGTQDWDGLWRYLWSHDAARAQSAGDFPIAFLEQANDPLAQASERAGLALFLRGDIRPLAQTFTLAMPAGAVDPARPHPRTFDVPWTTAAWYARFGCAVGTNPPPDSVCALTWPGDATQLTLGELERRLDAGRRTPGDGQVAIDRVANAFTVTTPRTCGGTVERGGFTAGALTVDGLDRITTVWVSAMDAHPLATSRRMLVQHLTAMYNTGDAFADRKAAYMVAIGRPPHLVPRCRATVTLRTDVAENLSVWAVDTAGRRVCRVPSTVEKGALRFVCDTALDPANATIAYEIVSRDEP